MVFFDTTLNFNIKCNYLDKYSPNNRLYEYLAKFGELTTQNWRNPEELQKIEETDIIQYLQHLLDTKNFQYARDQLIERTYHQICREFASNRVYLNGASVISPEIYEAIADTKDKEEASFFNYIKLLIQIKQLLPSVTNLQLFYLLCLLPASTDEPMQFFMFGFLQWCREKGLEAENEIFSPNFKCNLPESTSFTNFIDRVVRYQNPISQLFNLKVSDGGIMRYIEGLNEIFITTNNGKLTITVRKICFLYLQLNRQEDIATLLKKDLLIGLLMSNLNANITDGTIEQSNIFRWTIDNRTMDYLLCEMDGERLLSFLPYVPVLLTDPFKKFVYKCTGHRLKHYGKSVRPGSTSQLPLNTFTGGINNKSKTKKKKKKQYKKHE